MRRSSLASSVSPNTACSTREAERLQQLQKDKLEAKYEMRLVLYKYAEKYGIRPKDVTS